MGYIASGSGAGSWLGPGGLVYLVVTGGAWMALGIAAVAGGQFGRWQSVLGARCNESSLFQALRASARLTFAKIPFFSGSGRRELREWLL